MTTWILLGGPHHGATGEDGVPSGYSFEGEGNTYGPTYSFEIHDAEHVYRWDADRRDIEDGHRLLDALNDGSIHFGQADGVRAFTYDVVAQHLYALKDMPESDFAEGARTIIDEYRRQGLI